MREKYAQIHIPAGINSIPCTGRSFVEGSCASGLDRGMLTRLPGQRELSWNPDTGWQQVNEPVRIHYLHE